MSSFPRSGVAPAVAMILYSHPVPVEKIVYQKRGHLCPQEVHGFADLACQVHCYHVLDRTTAFRVVQQCLCLVLHGRMSRLDGFDAVGEIL